jgi:hypothetical protein
MVGGKNPNLALAVVRVSASLQQDGKDGLVVGDEAMGLDRVTDRETAPQAEEEVAVAQEKQSRGSVASPV